MKKENAELNINIFTSDESFEEYFATAYNQVKHKDFKLLIDFSLRSTREFSEILKTDPDFLIKRIAQLKAMTEKYNINVPKELDICFSSQLGSQTLNSFSRYEDLITTTLTKIQSNFKISNFSASTPIEIDPFVLVNFKNVGRAQLVTMLENLRYFGIPDSKIKFVESNPINIDEDDIAKRINLLSQRCIEIKQLSEKISHNIDFKDLVVRINRNLIEDEIAMEKLIKDISTNPNNPHDFSDINIVLECGNNAIFKPEQMGMLYKLDREIKKGKGKGLTIEETDNNWTFEEVVKANRTIRKTVDFIKENNFSPMEALYYAYTQITDRKYLLEGDDEHFSLSRSVIGILNHETICCAGYANWLKKICDELDMSELKTLYNFVDVECKEETSYSFMVGGKNYERHANNVIYLKDEKYGIDGYYYVDGCWDNCEASTQKLTHFLVPISDVQKFSEKVYPVSSLSDINTLYSYENTSVAGTPYDIRGSYSAPEKDTKHNQAVANALDNLKRRVEGLVKKFEASIDFDKMPEETFNLISLMPLTNKLFSLFLNPERTSYEEFNQCFEDWLGDAKILVSQIPYEPTTPIISFKELFMPTIYDCATRSLSKTRGQITDFDSNSAPISLNTMRDMLYNTYRKLGYPQSEAEYEVGEIIEHNMKIFPNCYKSPTNFCFDNENLKRAIQFKEILIDCFNLANVEDGDTEEIHNYIQKYYDLFLEDSDDSEKFSQTFVDLSTFSIDFLNKLTFRKLLCAKNDDERNKISEEFLSVIRPIFSSPYNPLAFDEQTKILNSISNDVSPELLNGGKDAPKQAQICKEHVRYIKKHFASFIDYQSKKQAAPNQDAQK